jgi:tetraacyldisaccharide 4'-kinase
LADGAVEPLENLSALRIAAFCGIGNPEGFRRTLEALSVNVAGFRAFRDHHAYSASDVADLGRWAGSLGADLLLTTQKDSVKLRVPAIGPVPLRALKIGLELVAGRSLLEDALSGLLPRDLG